MILAALVLVLLPGERVVLREESAVEHRFVRLLDLVEAEGLLPESRELFSDVWLGRAPEEGEDRIVNVGEIRKELERRGVSPLGFEFVGDSVRIWQTDPRNREAGRAVSSYLQMDLRQRFLARGTGLPAERVAVRISYLSRMEFPEGSEVISVSPQETLRIGPVRFHAALRIPGEPEVVEVEGIARILQKAFVAYPVRDFHRNHVLTASDVEVKAIEVEETSGYITEPALLVGGKLLEEVRAGTPIRPGAVRCAPVVRRGETVQVEARVLRTQGRALEDGGTGERIRVEFSESRKVVVCVVLKPGLVRLFEGE